jgi:hypothetical protein
MKTLRHIASLHPVSEDRGAAAILVGVSLLMLMGFTALAIDASSAYNGRRGTQNAADNAALAAAWQQCNPDTVGSTPTNAAKKTAKDNGYDDADPDIVVTPTELSTGVWEVVISERQSGIFGQATPYAPDEMTVVSRAVAECEERDYLGGYALFSGGFDCSINEMGINSSTITVTGGIYSNEDLDIQGSTISVTGDIENRDPSGGSAGTFDKGPVKAYPVDLNIADYRAGGTKRSDPNFIDAGTANITNSWMVTNGHAVSVGGVGIKMTRPAGLYYTQGSVVLKNVSRDPGVKATFVSEGPMDFQQPVDMEGYDNVESTAYSPLVLFSNYPGSPSCTATAIKFSTAGVKSITGLIYAPNGAAEFSAADVDIIGSVLAYTIKAATASLTVTWQDAPGAPSEFEVNLLE